MRFEDLFCDVSYIKLRLCERYSSTKSPTKDVSTKDIKDIKDISVKELNNKEIKDVCQDSRKVISGSLFFALQGHKADGRKYIDDAVRNGAVAVVIDEVTNDTNINVPVPVIAVSNPRQVLAIVSKRFFCKDVDSMPVMIGVTGTNGKTSVVWLLSRALSKLSAPSVYIGTLGMMLFDSDLNVLLYKDVGATTPDPVSLWDFIGQACALGAKFVVMEASSHALVQDRVFGIDWSVAAFTNLTRDHLDYHGDLNEYARAKKLLFQEGLKDSQAEKKFAVINANDPVGKDICDWVSKSGVDIELLRFRSDTFLNSSDSLMAFRDVYINSYKADLSGLKVCVGVCFGGCAKTCDLAFEVSSTLVGAYNAENLITVVSVLLALGYDSSCISAVLKNTGCVPGRLERVECNVSNKELLNNLPTVFVDYAHTPDALCKAIGSLREITNGKIITVFGCGGNRDKGKRPLMGEAVAKFSDIGVVTTDNPRCEKPEDIINDVLPGLRRVGDNSKFLYYVEVDRSLAIRLAIGLAKSGDVVLVAGKGHENYQEIDNVKHPYSDVIKSKEELTFLLNQFAD